MNATTAWDDFRFWAQALNAKYPTADLLNLSDDDLMEMIRSLPESQGQSDVPSDGVYLWTLKSVWSAVRHGASDSDGVSDAEI